MIEFSLGMSAEEYIRKHRSLFNMVHDRIYNTYVKPVDVRRIPNEDFYLFYFQFPISKHASVHAFLTSNRKSLRISGWNDIAYIDYELTKSLASKLSTKVFVSVSFDTPLGKHIFHSSACKSSNHSRNFDDPHFNVLLTPHFLESYQARAPKCLGLNILHRFIINETMGYGKEVSGSAINCIHGDEGLGGYNCNKTYMNFNTGTSYGNLIGVYPDSGDPSGCVFQLNSYYPKTVDSRQRIDMFAERQ